MLSTQATKRVGVSAFNRDFMMDIAESERPVGSLVFGWSTMVGTIKLGDRTYIAQRAHRHNERVYEALIRLVKGGQKPKNPWTLRDDAGQPLAVAELVKASFAVSYRGESFTLRRKGQPYWLHREGSEVQLGWVGQQKILTRQWHVDLPAEFDLPFQIFLLVLLLGLTVDHLESSTT